MDFLVPNVPSVQTFQMFQTLPRHVAFKHLTGSNDLNDWNLWNRWNSFLKRGAFSQIDFDHLRIFRDTGRRTLGNLLPGAENYDAL